MSQTKGRFCLVLHGHLPYVLHHGEWPHGEDWLFEAAAETYLPLLATIEECLYFNVTPNITMGLTPVLLEQLCHAHFKDRFENYLNTCIEMAKDDEKLFDKNGEGHFVYLAQRWQQWYEQRLKQFHDIDRDIPSAFAKHAKAGHIELLTSTATHAYLPLLFEDNSIRAQMRAGIASSHRILGFRPNGMWLPECAYRPGGEWHPFVSWGEPKQRVGVEHMVGAEGVTHFYTENHLIEECRSEFIHNDGNWNKVDWDEAMKYPGRGWRNVLEPHLVNSDGTGPGAVSAFARDNQICEQVWSGSIGYPATGPYLEFHKKLEARLGPKRGHRYWKITGQNVGLGQKDPYYPDDIDALMHEQVSHFCDQIRGRLHNYHDNTGRAGSITASFDAELFGHWWFEGPRFIRDVLMTLNSDPHIEVSTSQNALEQSPPDKSVSLNSGSWGDGGDHRVWINDKTKWIWEVEYRAESLFGKLTFELPWDDPSHPAQKEVKNMLEKAGRELLLLQASDWPFVITRAQAIDYGIKRFVQHASRFENLCAIAEKLTYQQPHNMDALTDIEKFEIQDSELHDVIFPEMELDWWSEKSE